MDSITRHDVDVAISTSAAALRSFHGSPSNHDRTLADARRAAAHFRYVVETLDRIKSGAPADLVQRASTAAAAAQAAIDAYRSCLTHSGSPGGSSACSRHERAADHAATTALDRVFGLGGYSSQSHAQLVRLARHVK